MDDAIQERFAEGFCDAAAEEGSQFAIEVKDPAGYAKAFEKAAGVPIGAFSRKWAQRNATKYYDLTVTQCGTEAISGDPYNCGYKTGQEEIWDDDDFSDALKGVYENIHSQLLNFDEDDFAEAAIEYYQTYYDVEPVVEEEVIVGPGNPNQPDPEYGWEEFEVDFTPVKDTAEYLYEDADLCLDDPADCDSLEALESIDKMLAFCFKRGDFQNLDLY